MRSLPLRLSRWRHGGALLSLSGALALSVACDPPVTGEDGGTDAGADTALPVPDGGGLEGLPVSETLELAGFEGDVDVVYDDRGVPHIYGTTVHDVIMAEGYLMSRDRFGQMEFIRRNVLGRLAEVAGALSPGLEETDFDARVTGYGRMGRIIWEALQTSTDPVDIRTRDTALAFVEGINAYIANVRAGEEDPSFAGAGVLDLITFSPYFTDWEPADVFAMARFQAMSLSFDAGADVGRTRALAGIEDAFGGADDPRAAMFHDVMGDLPARAVYTRDGFNDGSTSALLPDFGPRVPAPAMRLPAIRSLDAAQRFFERMDARFIALGMGDEHRGSNNWLVGSDLSATGNPILSNDPHLSLISPPVWWYVHLNTARMGGEDMIDAEGVAFAGLPGVVLGFNRNIAWGATTTGYDVTDVYLEQITEGVGDAPDTVLFDEDGDGDLSNAIQVPIVLETETIRISGEGTPPLVRDVEFVPHHGPILPGTREPVAGEPGRFTALSVRYTGYDVSNELAYFTALLTATNVEEAAAAQDYFRVGSQNFIVIDRDDIRWSTESRVPIRDPRALTFDYAADGTHSGSCPLFVLDGTGVHEWTGDLDETAIPHDQNPERGWIATANQDNVGVTGDGNACNDEHYIGGDFDFGWRQDHIVGELERLAARGDITVEEMQTLQALTTSSTGTALRDRFVEILGDADAIAAAGLTADAARLADARTRLMAWSLETPHGVGATEAAVIADSVATSIFNAALTHTLTLALGDEGDAIGRGVSGDDGVRWIEQALNDPTGIHAALNEDGRSVFFDDLDTVEIETEETIVLRGVVAGLDFLAEALGADVSMWRWGRLHRVRFETVVPVLAEDTLSIPPADDPMFPDGFPRHGDWGAVDVGNFRMFARADGARVDDFMHGSGASMRMVVEMTPTGPRAYNALPGGQVYDPASPHHRDEADLWIANRAPALAFDAADIVAHFERRIVITTP